jgi:hypothetical protein
MWNNDDPKLRALAKAVPTSDPHINAAVVADGVFFDQIPDPTKGATHYRTPRCAGGDDRWSFIFTKSR